MKKWIFYPLNPGAGAIKSGKNSDIWLKLGKISSYKFNTIQKHSKKSNISSISIIYNIKPPLVFCLLLEKTPLFISGFLKIFNNLLFSYQLGIFRYNFGKIMHFSALAMGSNFGPRETLKKIT